MKKTSALFALILTVSLSVSSTASAQLSKKSAQDLEKQLKGSWRLTALSCAGIGEKLPMKYTLSFEGQHGEYVSTTQGCVQKESETYTYVSGNHVAIKQGLRSCDPNPCSADLPKSECGKETNPKLPIFAVEFSKHGGEMVLSTSDPNSIDCTGPGQSKPAVFTFTR